MIRAICKDTCFLAAIDMHVNDFIKLDKYYLNSIEKGLGYLLYQKVIPDPHNSQGNSSKTRSVQQWWHIVKFRNSHLLCDTGNNNGEWWLKLKSYSSCRKLYWNCIEFNLDEVGAEFWKVRWKIVVFVS